MKSNIVICCLLLSAFISSADDSLIKFVFDTISVKETKRDDGTIIKEADINIDGVFQMLRNKCKTKDVEKYALLKLKEMDKDDSLFNQLLLKTYLFFGEEGLRFLKDKLDKNNYGIKDVALTHIQERLQVISMAKKIKPKSNIEKSVLDRIINYAPADCDLLPPNPDDYFTFVLKFKQDDAELKIWCLIRGEQDEYFDSIIVSLNKNKGETLYFSYSYGFDRKEVEEYTESLRPTLKPKPDSPSEKSTVKDDKQPAPLPAPDDKAK